jgi:hypothetical protein
MSFKKLRVTTLTPIEKEAVIDHYKFGIRSAGSHKYTASLQLFILQSFNKIESADNIRHLISRSLGLPSITRKRKVNIYQEVFNATESSRFNWKDTFKNLYQICIESSPTLAEGINSGTLKKRAIIYHLRKLGKAHSYQPRSMKDIKVADIPSPIQHDVHKLDAMTTVEELEQVGVLGQFNPLGTIASPQQQQLEEVEEEEEEEEERLQFSQNAYFATNGVSITDDQMNVDGYRVECKIGEEARTHYASGLKAILCQSHIVSLPKGSSNDYMFLYQRTQSSRASTQGVVFLNIGKAINIYWLYTCPDLLCRGLGGSIVDKLFTLFPDKLFQLCSMRESAPFWKKMGFVPSDKNRREE